MGEDSCVYQDKLQRYFEKRISEYFENPNLKQKGYRSYEDETINRLWEFFNIGYNADDYIE